MRRTLTLIFASLLFVSCGEVDSDNTENGGSSENGGSTENGGSSENGGSTENGGSSENGESTENGGSSENGENTTGPKKRSLSGSRIVFKEYKFTDGAVYYDNTPFDTKYNRSCTVVNDIIQTYKGLEGCCVSFDGSIQDSLDFYIDSNCSVPANTKMSTTSLKVGDYVTILNNNSNTACTVSYYSFGRVENVINNDSLYYGSPSYCQPMPDAYKCYTHVTYREITTEEARALFVCAE